VFYFFVSEEVLSGTYPRIILKIAENNKLIFKISLSKSEIKKF
jgi:hypothetical protein